MLERSWSVQSDIKSVRQMCIRDRLCPVAPEVVVPDVVVEVLSAEPQPVSVRPIHNTVAIATLKNRFITESSFKFIDVSSLLICLDYHNRLCKS